MVDGSNSCYQCHSRMKRVTASSSEYAEVLAPIAKKRKVTYSTYQKYSPEALNRLHDEERETLCRK